MGIAHTFRVDSETARVLVLSTPAGLERMVRDRSVIATTPTLAPNGTPRPSPEQLESIFQAHGQTNVGPPLAPHDSACTYPTSWRTCQEDRPSGGTHGTPRRR